MCFLLSEKRAIVFSGEGEAADRQPLLGDTVGTITNPPKLKEEKGHRNSGDFAVTNGGHWNTLEHLLRPLIILTTSRYICR